MNLQELEARLQTLIEIDFLKALPGGKAEDVIVHKLAAALARYAQDNPSEAPNVYDIHLHPQVAEKWQNPNFLATLLHSITTVAQEAGFRFTMSPVINIVSNANIQAENAEVIVLHRTEPMADTNVIPINSNNAETEENAQIPSNAFLIVEGVKVFPLTTPVVNIGRRLDNQLVIDDPRVSRNHSQLRAIKGRYVVFDLNSTGGTFVNGQRTNQSVLYPGDVISLAGVSLIFGQDNPPPRLDLKDTAPLQSAAAERPTAFLNRAEHSTDELKKPK